MVENETNLTSIEDALRPRLTDEFLFTLILAARICGWSVDHCVTEDFVRWCHDIAGVDQPQDLEPFGD